jgi:diguanylate cyclase (GGDEF)-like protein
MAELLDPAVALPERGPKLRLLEALIVGPLVLWLVYAFRLHPAEFLDWRILIWVSVIAIVDLLPLQADGELTFSLSFPIELSAALVYPPPVAALITLLGAADIRELRGELPALKALYSRSQIAWSVALESLVFHQLAALDRSSWFVLGTTVLLASLAGYAVNVAIVALYAHLQMGRRVLSIIREMHVGLIGEFVISYMGLALFSVLVAISTQTTGLWALVVFIAPLAFARRMFQRTQSLQQATEELAERQAENEYQALHDSLTGLPNRTLFQLRLAGAIEHARRQGGQMAVMLMDLDHFKEINDTLGHHFGDLMLQEIGPRLATALREDDLMARLGGDEFGVLLPDLPDEQTAVSIAERLLAALQEPIEVEGLALEVAGSAGIAFYPEDARDAETLLRRADMAMYAAKSSGSGYSRYDEELDRGGAHRLSLLGQVRPGLDRGEFLLHYQPKVRTTDGRVAGIEALARWQHPTLGLLSSDEFVPLLEETVLIRPFTGYVIQHALQQWREWAAMGARLPISVNLSPRSLLDVQFPEQVAELLEAAEVPAAFLTMELTENFLLSDSGRSISVLDRLARVGVGLSIDDFGTGYSSLNYLRRLPLDELKIDRSFVMQMRVDANDFAIVHATTTLGKNLGLRVVAEGVEDGETFDKLAELGCDEAQGYYIALPMTAVEFTGWLAARHADTAEPSAGERSRLRAI